MPPKFSFHLWATILGRLPTMDRLGFWRWMGNVSYAPCMTRIYPTYSLLVPSLKIFGRVLGTGLVSEDLCQPSSAVSSGLERNAVDLHGLTASRSFALKR